MKKIWSQYFKSPELGAKLLGVESIDDCYLLNLRDRFSDEELLAAWERQEELARDNELEFIIDYCLEHHLDSEEFNINEHQEEFAEYLLKQLQN